MKFKYKVVTISGTEQVGKINAASRDEAIELLQKHKLVIINIKQDKEWVSFNKLFSFLHRVSSQKIVMFSKELSVLLMAGIPLVEALRIQHDQEENAYFKEQLFTIANMIDDGSSFSSALSCFPNIFSGFYINIIRSGEASGTMQKSLTHLADYIEKQYLLNSKVKNALMYPGVIITGFALVGAVMMAFVVPQLTSIFRENDQELPLPTQILIIVSDFMKDNFILLIIGTIVLAYGLKKYIGTQKGKENFDKLIFKIPKFKSIFRKFYVARFAENLSMLIKSGVPIISALKISGDVVGNEVYKKVIYSSIDEVKIGGSVAYAFERSDQLPPLVPRMIRIGEKTGKLDAVLEDIAGFYTKEVNIAVDGLMALIEPILIFVLGAGVGILVAAILMPIYQMTEMF
ncbi:MAG: type II secretion system F family protein [Candidatus Pacebacteria bacterium]|nr:type II secretion system F family protein [Candidatus Paceibacterota bacterium]